MLTPGSVTLDRQTTHQKVLTFVCVNASSPLSLLKELSEKLSRQIEVSSEELSSLDEVAKILPEGQSALIVSAIQDQNDLERMLVFLNTHKKSFAAGTLKMLLVDGLNESFVSSLLRMRGNVETLSLHVSIKELNFKVRTVLRILEYRATQKDPSEQFIQLSGKAVSLNENKLKRELAQVEHTFESLSIRVIPKNRHSKEEERDALVKLIEIYEQNCILEIPDSLLENPEIILEVSTPDTPSHAIASFRLAIAQVLGSGGGRSVVVIRLEDHFEENLKSIVKQFELRRDALMGFFTGGKGAF